MTQIFNWRRETIKRRQLRNKLTETEAILWMRLKAKQVNGFRFRRQYSVGPYVADFYCPEAKLVVEIDGGIHLTTEAQLYDKEREEYMNSLGLKTIRFTNDEVRKNLSGVVLKITSSLH
jgi:very-short-patch-repair endonuclease